MHTEETQVLELLPAMKRRWGPDLNPGLQSIKFSQRKEMAVIELTFENEAGVMVKETTNFDFIADSEEEDDLTFKPSNDVVDNAQSFVAMDGYSIINCFSNLLNIEAEHRINQKHLKEYFKQA